ncbi:DOMON domain-containing protein [Niabella aquatica]
MRGTAMVVSNDNGKAWTPAFGGLPYYVLRTKYMYSGQTFFNNQMPSVIKLNNSVELAAAMEANTGGGNYYISFAYSGEDSEWAPMTPDQEGPQDRNDRAFKGSGPCIRQFASGETVVSYNLSSAFNIRMGDAKGRIFSDPYLPFPGKGYWGTLEMVDSHQIIGAMPNTSAGQVMLSKFILNHCINATKRSVKVDGDNSEWKDTDEAVFVGQKSQAQATLRVSVGADSVYFLVEVLDDFISSNDYATIFISPNSSNEQLNEGAYKLNVAFSGLKQSFVYNGGWVNGSFGATAKAAYKGTVSNNSDKDLGYIVEIAIPRSKLNILSGQLLVNFSITDSRNGEDAIVNTSSTSTAKWTPVNEL